MKIIILTSQKKNLSVLLLLLGSNVSPFFKFPSYMKYSHARLKVARFLFLCVLIVQL